MKKPAIVYGAYETGLQKKAVEVLSGFLLDYTFEYPVCLRYESGMDLSGYRCIYIGTAANNGYIAAHSGKALEKGYKKDYN